MQTTKVITTKTTKEKEACFLKQAGTNRRGNETTAIQTNAFNVKETSPAQPSPADWGKHRRDSDLKWAARGQQKQTKAYTHA